MNMWDIYHNYLKDNNITYAEYIESSHWKNIRLKFYNSRKSRWRCDACKSKKDLNIHHKTYERIGKELLEDLCLLCSVCHNKIHSTYKYAKKELTLLEVTENFILKIHAKNRKNNKIKSKKVSPNQCTFILKNGVSCMSKKQNGYKYCGNHVRILSTTNISLFD